MLIEDELSDQFLALELLTSQLAAHGITADASLATSSLGQARQILARMPATELQDLVTIVDLNLRDSRGLQTWELLRTAHPHMRMIALTGDAEAGRVLEQRGCPVLLKDEMDRLAEVVMAVVNAGLEPSG